MLVAYREFSNVTDELVRELRQTHQLKVVAGIESFTKRSAIRNIENTAGLDKQELGIIYDKFYNVLYYKEKSMERNDSRMDLKSFQLFIASLAPWAKVESSQENEDELQYKVAQKFFNQLFKLFDVNNTQSLSLKVKKGREKLELQMEKKSKKRHFFFRFFVFRMLLLELDLSIKGI